MREFAKAFYESPAWRRTRAYILKRDAGLCVHCGEPGVIVHHKIELTPRNIDDPAIALGEDTANAETDTSATLKIIRYLDGSAAAVATASGVFVRVLLPSALAEAEAGSVGDYIRTLFFSALAEAVATASGTGVSTYGSVTMVIEGVNMVAGDELIIDTEHMTVTLNGANIIDRVSDDSAFFKLQPGENDIIVEGGTTADVKILWKDRWL